MDQGTQAFIAAVPVPVAVVHDHDGGGDSATPPRRNESPKCYPPSSSKKKVSKMHPIPENLEEEGTNDIAELEKRLKPKPSSKKSTPAGRKKKKGKSIKRQDEQLYKDESEFGSYRVFHPSEAGEVIPSLKKKIWSRKKNVVQDEWTELRLHVQTMYDIVETQHKKGEAVTVLSTMKAGDLAKRNLIPFIGADAILSMPSGSNLIRFSETSIVEHELSLLQEEVELNHEPSYEERVLNKQKDINICAVCAEPATSKCQGCLAAGYCCRSHQKQHWKEHRPLCKLYEVVKDPTSSDRKVLIAKSTIKKGEVIFIEEPYFVIPFSDDECLGTLQFEPISEENKTMPVVGKYSVEEYNKLVCPNIVVCLGCNIYLEGKSVVPCKDCGWPTCKVDCAQLDRHRELECAYFKAKKLDFETCFKSAIIPPRILGILRGLLLQKQEPAKFYAIINDALKKSFHEKSWNCNDRCFIEYFLVILKKVFLFKNLDYKDLVDVVGLIYTRGIYGTYSTEEEEGRMISVYYDSTLISHQNIGNVMTIQTFPNRLQVIATTTIRKGEVFFQPIRRQFALLEEHAFLDYLGHLPCDCPFCRKLTEEEKALTAVLCLKCKRRKYSNYMMIEEPALQTSNWKCPKCGSIKTCLQVQQLTGEICREFESIMEMGSSPNVNPLHCEYLLRKTLTKYKENVLHPSHYVILNAELNLLTCLMMHQRLDSLDSDEMDLVINLLKERIGIMSKYLPTMHNLIISLKVRLGIAIGFLAGKIVLRPQDILSFFRQLQGLYDEVASSYTECTRRNLAHGYILVCLRHIRKIMSEVGDHYKSQQRLMCQATSRSTSTIQQNRVVAITPEGKARLKTAHLLINNMLKPYQAGSLQYEDKSSQFEDADEEDTETE